MFKPSILLLTSLCVGALASMGCENQVPAPGCSGAACEETPSTEPPRLFVDPPFGLGYDCVTIGCDTERRLVVENRGGGKVRLVLTRLSVGTSTDFSLRRGDGSALPVDDATAVDVLPNQPLELFVRYAPTDGDADTGAVVLDWHDGTKPYEDAVLTTVEVPLSTRALGDVAALADVQRLNFGFVPLGGHSTRTITIGNTGNGGVLTMGPVSLEDGTAPVFQAPDEAAWLEQFVNPESSGSFDVVFRPDSAGTFTGALHVLTNDGAQPSIRVEVVGTAIGDPVVSVAVGSLDFLAIRVGGTRTLPLVVTNTGGAPLQITPAIVAGTELSLSTTETIVIPALESTTLQLTWAPTFGGPMTGRLSLNTNDPQRPVVDVDILGHGNAPVLSASPPAIDFGRVVQNWQTGAQTFTLTNTGFGELSVNSIVFDPSASSSQIRFVELPPLPFKLQPGASTTVSLALDATTLGNVSSVVLVGTDSIDGGVSVAGVARLDARGEIVDCNTGCPVSNGEPTCAVTNVCGIASCINRFHDANGSFGDGCECGEDLVPAGGGARRDVDGACGGMDLGTLNDSDNPRSTTYSGTIHSATDVDVFFYRARDQSQFINDDYGARVDLLSGPPGLRLFARFADSGTGCGGENQRSGPVGPGGGLQGRGNSTSDNSEDVTVWVEWTPGVPPICAEYSVRFRADNDN